MSKYCAVQLRVPVRVTVLSNSAAVEAAHKSEPSARLVAEFLNILNPNLLVYTCVQFFLQILSLVIDKLCSDALLHQDLVHLDHNFR